MTALRLPSLLDILQGVCLRRSDRARLVLTGISGASRRAITNHAGWILKQVDLNGGPWPRLLVPAGGLDR